MHHELLLFLTELMTWWMWQYPAHDGKLCLHATWFLILRCSGFFPSGNQDLLCKQWVVLCNKKCDLVLGLKGFAGPVYRCLSYVIYIACCSAGQHEQQPVEVSFGSTQNRHSPSLDRCVRVIINKCGFICIPNIESHPVLCLFLSRRVAKYNNLSFISEMCSDLIIGWLTWVCTSF